MSAPFERSRLAQRLRRVVRGDVLFDAASRGRYATDASIYQIDPIGVVVPRKLAALVDRCLAKDPAHRPASAQSVGEQLGMAIEQRRELPVALRAFVRRNGRLDGGGTLISAAVILPSSVYISAEFGLVAGFAAFFAGAVLFPLGYFARSAYNLSLKGFAHQDLKPAFDAELERAR